MLELDDDEDASSILNKRAPDFISEIIGFRTSALASELLELDDELAVFHGTSKLAPILIIFPL